MAARRKASRHNNPTLATSFLSLRWSETTEAIPLQATLVFGLLRYYRNNKKARSPHSVRDDKLPANGRVVFKRLLAITIHSAFAMTRTLLAKKQIFFQKIHSFLK
jgi:hypothetical protein